MRTQLKQGKLWGKRARDWAIIQEPTAKNGYVYALKQLQESTSTTLLDVGCGSGLFCKMAAAKKFIVTGLDASDALIALAKLRVPSTDFYVGKMEKMPFADNTFDIVTAFNAFQHAGNIRNAINEAKRVLRNDGKLAVMIWGNQEDCEASSYIKVIAACLPPAPPGAPGPFALSENNLLQQMLADAGFEIEDIKDVDADFVYHTVGVALRGLMSTCPAARAIEYFGAGKVREALLASMQPFIQKDGQVIYRNKFKVAIATKPHRKTLMSKQISVRETMRL